MEISGNVLTNGVKGFNAAKKQMAEASHTIATSSTQSSNGGVAVSANELTNAVIDLLVSENAAKANAKSIETGSETIGTLLDIKA
ncbi:MAG: hypothetical protein AAGB12_04760 [Pseudomonadota bacterium]